MDKIQGFPFDFAEGRLRLRYTPLKMTVVGGTNDSPALSVEPEMYRLVVRRFGEP